MCDLVVGGFQLINRRIGGLEMVADRAKATTDINRRIGGLENVFINAAVHVSINRRIGGLENVFINAAVHVSINRRIGGLEMATGSANGRHFLGKLAWGRMCQWLFCSILAPLIHHCG